MMTLAIDASTYAGDVALLEGHSILAEEGVAMKGAEHERLMPAVGLVLERARRRIGDVDRIVVGAGPGSFTSLRIAGGIAKGLARGARIPLYAVPSTALIIGGAGLHLGRYLVALDALRDEFYVALFHLSANGDVLELEPVRLVNSRDVSAIAAEYSARIVGPSRFEGGVVALPRASAVRFLEPYLDAAGPVDVGQWEPSYGRLAEAQVKWESLHGRPLSI